MSAYLDIFEASPMQRIQQIRTGVKRTHIRELARSLGLQENVVLSDLNIDSLAAKHIIPPEFSERIIGLMAMIGQVESMTRRLNPSADFDAAKWLGTWLNSPLPALGGLRPGSFLDTMVGQGLLANLIAMTESGAYA